MLNKQKNKHTILILASVDCVGLVLISGGLKHATTFSSKCISLHP